MRTNLLAFAAAVGLAAASFSCVKETAANAPDPLSAEPPAVAVMSARVDPAALPPTLSYEDLARLLADPKASIRLLDVRTPEEYAAGHIPGAVLAPYDSISADSFAEPDKAAPIVVYCRSGRRSAIAAESLKALGYSNVSDFGGIDNWKGALER